MSITGDILMARTNINNNKRMIQHWNDKSISYDIEKYQEEYFHMMEKMHLFKDMSSKMLNLKDGILLEIKKLERVPNFAFKQEFNLFNFELHFSQDGNLLMIVTMDPHTNLRKKVENGRVKDIIGVECISIQKFAEDEDAFISAVNAFKYVMNNLDDVLAEMEEKQRKEYLYIMSNHYYEDLTFLNKIKDMKEMVRMYIKNPFDYHPIITEQIKAPDYSSMSLQELICEFNKKISDEQITRELNDLCDEFMDYFPNMEQQSNEILNFFSLITGSESYISSSEKIVDEKVRTQIVYNNGFSYKFCIYDGSSQMLIDILKRENRIGSMYYWENNRTKKKFKLYIERIGFGKRGFRGLDEKTIPDFINGVKNLSENWSNIVTPVLSIYSNFFEETLNKYNLEAEEAYKMQMKAKEDFFKRQEAIEKYF